MRQASRYLPGASRLHRSQAANKNDFIIFIRSPEPRAVRERREFFEICANTLEDVDMKLYKVVL